jgi:hypothetical protein
MDSRVPSCRVYSCAAVLPIRVILQPGSETAVAMTPWQGLPLGAKQRWFAEKPTLPRCFAKLSTRDATRPLQGLISPAAAAILCSLFVHDDFFSESNYI